MGRVGRQEESERFRRIGNRIGRSFIPFVALAQALQLAFPVPGARWLTFELIVLGAIALLTSPWWWRRRLELSPTARLTMAAFLALVAYGIVSLLLHPEPVVTAPGGGPVPKIFVLVPLLTAVAAMFAGVGMVLSAERAQRMRILAWGGLAALVVAFLGWPFQSAHRNYVRLATGQGGAAIIHVMFLIIVALGLAQYVRGRRPWLTAGLVFGGLAAVIATQSRGAIVNIGAWLSLIAAGWLIHYPKDSRKLWPVGLALMVGVFSLPFVPGLSRITSFEEPKRAENLLTALNIWSQDPVTMAFGTGPGRVWPWYAYESGLYPMPGGDYTRFAPTPFGDILLTPHSTPLAMLVELGIVGALLGLLMGASLLLGWWRSRTSLARLIVSSATLACLVAFLVDTYLLRNFGISMWWWATIALVSSWQEATDEERAARAHPARRGAD
ncbi:O-Antigen ligase [Tessaracoccus oleiagri]|uniref:O-Antigen ligase n=1 Tax=Tessaracoccus oleiagri TaxID=686624 RepID=A0A1G9HET0_9ACTN|nr:O-Antigen ligase [Tessaracoccus oleiagri]